MVEVLRPHAEALCLVLPCGDRNLLDAVQAEFFAGRDKPRVVAILTDVCLALEEMHNNGLVHGDVKVCVGGYFRGAGSLSPDPPVLRPAGVPFPALRSRATSCASTGDGD